MNTSTTIDKEQDDSSIRSEETTLNLLELEPDEIVNLKGIRCPMAALTAKKAIDNAKPGQILEIISPELGTKMSIPWLSKRKNNKYLGMIKKDGDYHFFMQKAEDLRKVTHAETTWNNGCNPGQHETRSRSGKSGRCCQ